MPEASIARKQLHARAHHVLTLALAVLLPFGSKLFPDEITSHVPILSRLISVVIILIGINWLAGFDLKEKLRASVSSRLPFLFILLFLLPAAGMLYTSNLADGGKELETKLSLLLFPLFYGINYPVTRERLRSVFIAFILSCLVASIACFARVIVTEGFADTDKFFYSALSYFIHPGYFSMYISVAICMLVWLINYSASFAMRVSCLVMIAMFLVMQVFLASKSGILVAALLVMGFCIAYVIKYKKYAAGGIALLVLVVSSYFVVTRINAVGWRFLALKNSVFNDAQPQASSTESSDMRKLVWQTAHEAIADNPVAGVGTGDSRDELLARYKQKGMELAYEKRLNTHSEYLQHLVTFGIIGLIVLAACLLVPLVRTLRNGYWLYGLFMLIVIANFFTESMLQAQAGVVFYAFFNALLANSQPNSARNNS